MTFAYPAVLFLLLLLIPFAMLAAYNFRKKREILREFIAEAAEDRVVVRGGREIDFFKTSLLLAALAFFILALARPQWGERFESMDIRGLEIVFLLDTSASMNAEDLPPSRLEVARNLVAAIVDALRTDMVSQVNFAGSAYVQCPPTLDYEAFKLLALASAASPDAEQGTDFAKAFALGLRLFRNSPSSQKLMILVTDGEDQEQGWPEAVRELQKRKITVFTVGVGAAGGAPIPIRDGSGRTTGWKKDTQGNIVRSQLDETTLASIAADCGGQYYRLGAASGIAPLIGILRAYERQQLSRKVKSRRIDRFAYPLLLAVLLLAGEMALSDRRIAWRKG
ncbi:MAG: VWA domain-containing protein [Acidobacteria bacterium]|jgi:Ca-activated chloride channel family protein|nr:VWA domain-containing protein [Acidobacteriota bacterium]